MTFVCGFLVHFGISSHGLGMPIASKGMYKKGGILYSFSVSAGAKICGKPNVHNSTCETHMLPYGSALISDAHKQERTYEKCTHSKKCRTYICAWVAYATFLLNRNKLLYTTPF